MQTRRRLVFETPPYWEIYLAGMVYVAGVAAVEVTREVCEARSRLCEYVVRLPDDFHQEGPHAPKTNAWLSATSISTASVVLGGIAERIRPPVDEFLHEHPWAARYPGEAFQLIQRSS
jgi:hypothetical protein